MAKLKRMLGDATSMYCIELMKLIETQSKETLALWAMNLVEERYVPIFKSVVLNDLRVEELIKQCKACIDGKVSVKELKPQRKELMDAAKQLEEEPACMAALRAITTACGILQTPTNALGYLFYGAAAFAYHSLGLSQTKEVYDKLAEEEFYYAIEALQKVAIQDEPNPVNVRWNC